LLSIAREFCKTDESLNGKLMPTARDVSVQHVKVALSRKMAIPVLQEVYAPGLGVERPSHPEGHMAGIAVELLRYRSNLTSSIAKHDSRAPEYPA
jgi:hypothetical protein